MKYYILVHNFMNHQAYASINQVLLNKINNESNIACATMCATMRKECISDLVKTKIALKLLKKATRYNMNIQPIIEENEN